MTTASGGTGRTGFSEQLHHLWRTRPLRLPGQSPVAGVAAGFGRRYGVDPVLIRVAFVVSTVFGGAGIVLYLAAWLLLPAIDRDSRPQSPTKTTVLVVALVIALSTMGPFGVGLGGSGVVSFALMVAGWWLLYMRQPEPPTDGSYPLMADGGIAATGYPGTTFPGGSPWGGGQAGQPWNGSQYGPFTTLPDHYEPDPGTAHSPAANPAGDPTGPAGTAATEPIPTEPETSTATPSASGRSPQAEDETATAAGQATDPDRTVAEPVSTADPTVPATAAADQPTEVLGIAETDAATEHLRTAVPGDEDSTTDNSSDEGATRPEAGDSDHSTGAGPGDATPGTDTPPASGGPGTPGSGGTPPPRSATTTRTAADPSRFGPTPSGWDPLGVTPLAWDLPAPVPTPPRPVAVLPAQRPRSRLTPVVIGLAVLAAAAAGSLTAAGVEWMTPARIGAVALAVVALGLIVGAFLRRGYGLMVLLAPLAGFVILASMIGPVEFDRAAMGRHEWKPPTATALAPDYKITMGSGHLDLTGLTLTEDRTVHIGVQMGDFQVVVPDSMRVHTRCDARMGEVTCPPGITGPPDGPTLTLDIDVHAGNAEVQRG